MVGVNLIAAATRSMRKAGVPKANLLYNRDISCQIIHVRPDARHCYEPPEQSRDIVPHERIISRASLYIACRIEEGGQRHAKERIRIVYHLLVFQASRQAKVAHVECLRYGRPDELDKATEHGES